MGDRAGDVLDRVRAAVYERLGGVPCADDEDLEGLGFGSLDVIVVVSGFEQEYGFSVGDDDLEPGRRWTVGAIAQLVEERARAASGDAARGA